MPYVSDLILEPSAEPINPQPGQFWIPNSGKDVGELHVWSPKRGGWLNLYDNSTRERGHRPLWQRMLRSVGLGRNA